VNQRTVRVQVLLEGGHSQKFEMLADAPQLREVLQGLAAAQSAGANGSPGQLIQLPLDGGRESFSFNSSQLVAVITRPPVLLEFEKAPAPMLQPASAAVPVVTERPRVMVIDNFLGHYEHQDMLALALRQEDKFDPGTVMSLEKNSRKNLAIMHFAQHAHSKLLCNRLLTWFPQITQTLEIDLFPVQQVESQLTASNDGHYYHAHQDSDHKTLADRVLTCVYYFSKQPIPFNGGDLRIYDTQVNGDLREKGKTYQQVKPVSNRMVIFLSHYHHELLPIRCPSRKFEDSRFAVTNWIWRSKEQDPEATMGWGHMRCNKVPEKWLTNGGVDS